MAPELELRGVEHTDSLGPGHIVRISDIRRLGAWRRTGSRSSSRGTAAIARRDAMRRAVAKIAVARPAMIAAATELAGTEVTVASGALCVRATRSLSPTVPAAWSRLLCAAAA
jgi:hypothetical protein